jgi:hypothetical protein
MIPSLDKLADDLAGRLNLKTKIIVRKFESAEMLALGKPYEVGEHLGNVGCNSGIQVLWDVAIGKLLLSAGYHSGVAQVGVGTCSGVAAATDAGLWSGTAYIGMDASYPIRSGNACAWQGTFPAEIGNAAWNEFVVTRGSGFGAVPLIHSVSAQGTKLSGQQWQLSIQVNMT